MSHAGPVVVTGFLPWVDPGRDLDVRENPAILSAISAVERLRAEGLRAVALGVEVTANGIRETIRRIEQLAPSVVVSLGQGRETSRVERFGRVPGAWTETAEDGPWPLPSDAARVLSAVNACVDPAALTGPFVVSDDPGAYFCDHLCVELVRASRRCGFRATFLHVPPIDGVSGAIRSARLAQYSAQAAAAARVLVDARRLA